MNEDRMREIIREEIRLEAERIRQAYKNETPVNYNAAWKKAMDDVIEMKRSGELAALHEKILESLKARA